MKNENLTLIIKKISRGNEGGSHGGAWKVAFADFMTAMMSFFLVMWLVNIVTPEKRGAIAEYMRNYRVFPSLQGSSPVGKAAILPNASPNPPIDSSNSKSLMSLLKVVIDTKLLDLQNSIVLRARDNGVRLDILDPDDNRLTAHGGTQLNEKAERTIQAVSEAIANYDYKIALEGHTDNQPSPSPDYTNWELSAGRALSARKAFVDHGIENGRITQVTGYAASRPLVESATAEAKNRRISVYISNTESAPLGDMLPISERPRTQEDHEIEKPAENPVKPAEKREHSG